ncbi:glycosyltransferase [Shewanella sp. 5_MG-2023]|uniref:glycosyltransferase n=1 Tax=Shewanella sp. 5_MG-2023 TaxID=3062656 RepID=UPI0026E2FB7F|nr:glycosyltransferase [Shewanella sp. 5_MG-2023]MDO6639185.1 glycosyltransferase [Shewanella sp. 5_MG-2023]
MKITLIYHRVGYGGASKMFVFLANLLSRSGYTVTVHTYSDIDNPHYPLDPKIVLIKRKVLIHTPIVKRFLDFISVFNVIRLTKPDLVVTLMSSNSFYSYIACRILGVKVIVSERGDPHKEVGIFSKLKHLTMNNADAAFFQTPGAMSFFSQKLQRKSIILPNPVIPEHIKIKAWSSRVSDISFVGRFELKQKRQDVMLDALVLVIKKFPNIILNFYGDGQDLDKVKLLSQQKSLDNNVRFFGAVSDVKHRLANSKYFVLTSDYEGIPNALIEAMSVGCACISTDCSPGGARFLIQNNVNGLLVPQSDSSAVADSLIYLLQNSDEAERLSHLATNVNEQFKPEVIGDNFLKFIKSVIS